MFDHYPWDSAMLIAPVLPPPPPRIKRGGYLVCAACGMVDTYCRCGRVTPDEKSGDARAESDLNRRIRDVLRDVKQ